LANQANLLSQPHNALPLAEEAYRLAHDHGLITITSQIQPLLDYLRKASQPKKPWWKIW